MIYVSLLYLFYTRVSRGLSTLVILGSRGDERPPLMNRRLTHSAILYTVIHEAG